MIQVLLEEEVQYQWGCPESRTRSTIFPMHEDVTQIESGRLHRIIRLNSTGALKIKNQKYDEYHALQSYVSWYLSPQLLQEQQTSLIGIHTKRNLKKH